MRTGAALLLLVGALVFAVACGGGGGAGKEGDAVKEAVKSGIKALLTFDINQAHNYWSDEAIKGITEADTAQAGLSRLQSLAALWEVDKIRDVKITGNEAQATVEIKGAQRPSGTTRGITAIALVHTYGLTLIDGQWKITSASKQPS